MQVKCYLLDTLAMTWLCISTATAVHCWRCWIESLSSLEACLALQICATPASQQRVQHYISFSEMFQSLNLAAGPRP